MAVSLQAVLNAPVIELDTIDSTNNYAMWLIDADTAQPGLTIVAKQQSKGKGQRGKLWTGVEGESLLMSIVIAPKYPIDEQFSFNMSVSLAISEVLQHMYERWDVSIKWPNDIIINDKKAGGVLIENVIRGDKWVYSVVGIGINVKQQSFPNELPFATSLHKEGAHNIKIATLVEELREWVLKYTAKYLPVENLVKQYHEVLYRKGANQRFMMNKNEIIANVNGVTTDGLLQLKLADGNIVNYNHGALEWLWGQ